MKKHLLTAHTRTEVGKKVKHLRKKGLLPATVYGKAMKSASVSVNTEEFKSLYKEAGETGLVELTVNGKVHPVLIHSVQVDAMYGIPLHVEFHQVDLKEEVHAKVSIEFSGESPAVAQKLGVLLLINDAIEVEALPAELPEKLHVDVSTLAEVHQELTIGSIALPPGVVLLSDPALIVVKIGPLVTKEAVAQEVAEEAQAAEASAESESTADAQSKEPESSEKLPESK